MGCLFVRVCLFLALLSAVVHADAPKLEGVVNINTASPDELRLLPGVGPSRVRNVLAYRHAHPFRTIEELARIKGIGRKTVRRLRLHLAVSGPSTAQKVERPTTPLMGPPQLPSPTRPPLGPARPPVGEAPQKMRLPLRRGDPTHISFANSPGNHCSPLP